MSLTPEDVERKSFKERLKGYDVSEVDTFLDRVVARLHELEQERETLRRQLEEARRDSDHSEQLVHRTLMTAERAAEETRAQARTEAERLVDEAREEAERLLAEAREGAVQERRAHEAEAEQLARVIDQLKEFRDGYVEQVRSVIQRQLERLERSSGLPDVPPEIEQLAASIPEGEAGSVAAGPQVPPVDPPSVPPAGPSVFDTGEGPHAQP
jgi:cell division initiation protein